MLGSPTITARTGHGSARGTCGELVQGVLPGGRRFHVTCPVDLGTRVDVRLSPAPSSSITGLPPEAAKTARALRRTAELLELGPVAIHATRITDLPQAKGMASSTADVVAAARALASAAGTALDAGSLAQLATAIEASDGVMYDGVVALGHRDGGLIHDWSWTPPFTIAAFVPAQDRITAEVDDAGPAQSASWYAALLDAFDTAMQARDLSAVARLATESAERNHPFTPNPLLSVIHPRTDELGALGLCVGHSGTVCGLLFAGGPELADDGGRAAAAAVDCLLPVLPPGTTARIVRTAG